MFTPKIDPEFDRLCLPLKEEEFDDLSRNIERDGLREAIVLWGDTILDGHNRYRICTKLGIEPTYQAAPNSVQTREDATNWIIDNQLGRRNLTPDQMALLWGRRYNAEKRQGARTDLTSGQSGQKSTAEWLAQQAGQSERTIRRYAQYADGVAKIAEVDPFTASQIEAGQSGLTRQQVASVAKAATPEAAQAVLDSQPYRARCTGNHEWYTPAVYVEAARRTMGTIDLDPPSPTGRCKPASFTRRMTTA